jgi:hypothetical protein
LNLRLHPYQQNTGNRCAEGRFPRSRSTVGAEVKCSNDLKLSALPTIQNRNAIALITATSCTTPGFYTAIYLHILPHHATSASLTPPHEHFLTNMTPHLSPFRSPIALPSYHSNPTHDSNALGAVDRAGHARGIRGRKSSSRSALMCRLLGGGVEANPRLIGKGCHPLGP